MMIHRKAKEPETGPTVEPLGNPRRAVSEAHGLLQRAVEKSFQVPSDVVVAITDAHYAVRRRGEFGDAGLETRFWNAYGLLSSIKPVEVARRRYKTQFYVLLALLITCQLYYLAGALVNKRLTDIEAEWKQVPAGIAPAGATEAVKASPVSPADAWVHLRRRATIRANYTLGTHLLPWFTEFAADPPAPVSTDAAVYQLPRFGAETERFAKNYMKMKGELEVVLSSLSGYVLPLLYGALGAFAFILRKLSDPVGKLAYAYDARVAYTLRVHIGALGGLAVGWFINGNAPISGLGDAASSGLVALSPLALAFAAGYGSDLLFTALDKVVAAFSPLASTQTSVRTEATFGGMTVTTAMQRGARVAGGTVPAPRPPEQETNMQEAKGDSEAELALRREPKPRAA